MSGENNKLPRLRFPEFRNAGDWEEKRLGNCLDYIQPTKYLVKSTAYSDNYNTPVLTAGKTFILGYTNELHGIFSDKLPVIIFDDFTTATKFVDFSFKAKSSAIKILMAKKDTSIKFIYESMQTINYEVGAHKRHWISIFAELNIAIPKPPEQQKIAACLTSLDDLITAQAQKLDTLKTHKKGMMQQLFPTEGETVPKRRFPEFQGAGDWEEMPLKKVFSIFQGFAFSSKDSVKNGVRWLKIADVSIQEMNHSTPSYLPNEHKDKHEKFSVKQGDYVIALTRPILSKQLKMAPVDKVFHGALLNQRVGRLVTTQNIEFIYFLLQTLKVISDIEKSISGSEPPNLSVQQIDDIKTYIPSSSKEQQKIATCLTSLDDLITAQAQKLDTLKTHKKGMMQQLFPTAKEAI